MGSKAVSTALSLIGLAVVGLGLLIGLAVPIHADGVKCGTALRATDDAYVSDLAGTFAGARGFTDNAVAACDSARNTPKVLVWVIIGLGGIATVTGVVIKGATTEIQKPTGPSPY
jgi:uncharacterized membrane protein